MNLKRFLALAFAILVVLSMDSTRLAAQTASSGDMAGVVILASEQYARVNGTTAKEN
jgi:hypothetical protein